MPDPFLDDLKERLIEAHGTSFKKSAVIDFLRAENRQLRDLLGMDNETVADFSVMSKLSALRGELKDVNEVNEQLKNVLKETLQVCEHPYYRVMNKELLDKIRKILK